ncbi:hypothetical protein [Cupriavidus basilensis]|uniref:hypothetical protein n=1 Tax=Cupriavidus basilensis TaxID=68895 RepID=UPI000750A12E|nr:hypothetical protein [Cupriavidus basilensis]
MSNEDRNSRNERVAETPARDVLAGYGAAPADSQVEATAAIIAAHLLGQPQRDDVEWVSRLIRAMLAASPAAQHQSEPIAWVHEEDPSRAISALQKAGMLRDGGAGASSVRPYSIAAFEHAAPQPSAKALALVREKLERFEACAADDEGCDIGRKWLEALTTIGLLSRTQHSPAMWSLTPAGEAVLDTGQPSEDKRDAAARTLERLGYTYHGAELWEPPIGSTATQLPRHALEAWRAVVRERRRQIAEEGWTPEHDDEHQAGDLARAGACYALHGGDDAGFLDFPPPQWPWAAPYWKPGTQHRNLVKAGALILAELERDIRAAIAKGDGT